jgi:hypothetical protein
VVTLSAALLIASAIGAYGQTTWAMEVAPVAIGLR